MEVGALSNDGAYESNESKMTAESKELFFIGENE